MHKLALRCFLVVHHGTVVDGVLQLDVCLLLYRLSVLQLLDEFHFEHFHLHHLCLFLAYQFLLLGYLSRDVSFGSHLLLPSELLHLGVGHTLLLLLELSFHLVLLVQLVHKLVLTLFVLLSDELALFGLFALVKHDGVLYFVFLLVSVTPHGSDASTLFALAHGLLLHLHVLLGLSLSVLDLKFVDLTSSSPGFIDLLPGLHLLLFQQGDTVRQKLSISLGTTKRLEI